MVDWCAVYRGTLDLGDFTLDNPVIRMLHYIAKPDLNGVRVTGVVQLYASRRRFDAGLPTPIQRYCDMVIAPADMPNNTLRAAWMAVAATYNISTDSFHYIPPPPFAVPA